MTKPLAMLSVLPNSRLWFALGVSALLCMPVYAQEWDLDLGVAGSSLSRGWGAAAHGQWLFGNGLGLDLGYRYMDRLEYDLDGETATHPFSQYETGLIWQEGNAGARFQTIVGPILAGYGVTDSAGNETLKRFTPGYRLDADISAPLFTRFRVFASAGYQGFYSDGMPNAWRWRYGIRLTLGNEVRPLERDEQARLAREQAAWKAEQENPSARIDPDVPQYMPGHLSQSLPSIVEHSEVCKCFPEGPYTLQLGEFRSMQQAVRAMDYRGLRQFFNTVAYERSPQPVFLAQSNAEGPVSLFVGEYGEVDQSDYWRRQLRRSGIEGRLRKVVGADGRTANRTIAVPTAESRTEGEYTAEEIRRMNSLPSDYNAPQAVTTTGVKKESGDESVNSADTEPAAIKSSLVVGPVNESQIKQWLQQEAYRDAFLVVSDTAMPGRQRLVWDATRSQGWLYMDGFEQSRQLDEWRAWFEKRGYAPQSYDDAKLPMGDTYIYTLGQALHGYSVGLDSQAAADAILSRMVSPQVLWFQAYQAINSQPPELMVYWSASDRRYHLVATGFARHAEARTAWQGLSSVGLLPSLVE